MKKIHLPALSTAFSEEGKKAKKRFENLLSKNKKRSLFLVCALLASIFAIEAFISCSGEKAEIIEEKLESKNIIIGDVEDLKDTSFYGVPVATVSTDIKLYLDKNLFYQNNSYLPYPGKTALALAYPTENENIFFVSVPAFGGGLYGYAPASELSFDDTEEKYDVTQILEDIPEKNILKNEMVEIIEKNGNIYTIKQLSTGEIFDVEKEKTGIGEDPMKLYPAVYDYIEKELKKYGGDFDNIMLDGIGFFKQRSTLVSDTNEYEAIFYTSITYTDKYTDEETLSYIQKTINSRDIESITYLENKGIFKHGMLVQMSIKFGLDERGKIDENTVNMSYNNGQVVTNLPIPNPREEWITIKNIGEVFPEKLVVTLYSGSSDD